MTELSDMLIAAARIMPAHTTATTHSILCERSYLLACLPSHSAAQPRAACDEDRHLRCCTCQPAPSEVLLSTDLIPAGNRTFPQAGHEDNPRRTTMTCPFGPAANEGAAYRLQQRARPLSSLYESSTITPWPTCQHYIRWRLKHSQS